MDNHPKWPDAIRLLASGLRGFEVARELGVTPPTITRWKKQPAFKKALKSQTAKALREGKKKEEAVVTEMDDFERIARSAEIVNMHLRPSQRQIVEAFDAGKKIAVFGGGNGAGKTFLALREALETCWGLKAWAPELSTVKIIGRSWEQTAQVFAPYVTKYIPEDLVKSWGTRKNGLPTHITFKNGSTLDFGTNEQGWAAHQGQRCNLIIYDEEPEYAVFEEGLARGTREGGAPRVLFTMTPTRGKGWVWDELICDRERRGVLYVTCAIFENGEGTCVACDTSRPEWDAILRNKRLERDPAEYPIHGGRWLNLQLQAMDTTTFSREEGYCHRCWTFGVQPFYEEDFIRNQIVFNPNKKRIAMRLLGSWENLDGSALFDGDKLSALSAHAAHPKIDDGYALQVWHEPLPGHPYVIGVDPARGSGGDESVFQVLDAATGEQCALWANNETRLPGQYQALKGLRRRYHNAFPCIENSSSGEGLVPMLEDERVPQWSPWSYNKDGDIQISAKVGLQPTQRNRSSALTRMVAAINKGLVQDPHTDKWRVQPGRPDALYINDQETVRQLSRMFYDEDGKIDSPKGASSHDDRVLALAFAWEAVRHPSVSNTARTPKSRDARERIRREHLRQANISRNSSNPWARRY